MEWPTIIPLVLLAIGVRVGLHFWDRKNITTTAELKGWREITVTWTPFAPGWFFENRERHYTVNFVDKENRNRELICKTSIFTGVYWRDENS
jgi:hypothetical protein